MRIKDIMVTTLNTVTEEQTLADVAKIMKSRSIQHVLVTSETVDLVGLISDRDIKKFLSPFAGSEYENHKDRATLDVQVGKVMRKEVITSVPNEDLSSGIEKLLFHRINSLPVVDGARLVGLVTTADFLKVLLKML